MHTCNKHYLERERRLWLVCIFVVIVLNKIFSKRLKSKNTVK